jgi:hypothetical protein
VVPAVAESTTRRESFRKCPTRKLSKRAPNSPEENQDFAGKSLKVQLTRRPRERSAKSRRMKSST